MLMMCYFHQQHVLRRSSAPRVVFVSPPKPLVLDNARDSKWDRADTWPVVPIMQPSSKATPEIGPDKGEPVATGALDDTVNKVKRICSLLEAGVSEASWSD